MNSKIAAISLSILVLGACKGFNDMVPESNRQLASQIQETTSADPSRIDAAYNGMYTKLGTPNSCGYEYPDDFGFIMISLSSDLEAADVIMPNSGYNWFSPCGDLSSRNSNYRNPLIRYKFPYDVISVAHDVIRSIDSTSADPAILAKLGEARAIRAFAYLNLVPYFQFSPAAGGLDEPCVPKVTLETTEFDNNPRASVRELYNLILSDLNIAIRNLKGWTRTDKSKIDQQVAYGLRARAYLNLGKYAEAAKDAEAAMEGYTSASMDEVSKPFLFDISEHNWIWGYDMTLALAEILPEATSTSWIRSFSANAYSTACQCYCYCNNLLYNKIPDSDVRKGWWVNESLYSPLLDGLVWDDLVGSEIATKQLEKNGEVVKDVYLPYTNVKFGVNSMGTLTNDEDWCWMRVEEMILIQAEGYAKSGNENKAKEILNSFVKTYRDPKYNCATTGRTLADEIWFQRRVELWGEGFSNNDTRRLNKPLVRFHSSKDNVPDAFRFNMTADDGWWLMRFSQIETNNNRAIVDNTEGSIPVKDQNPDLKDGVTD